MGGLEALVDESRRPDTSPVQTTADVAVEIIKLRQLHPTWGPRKLQALMARQLAGEGLPSSRTIARVLDRAALTKKRRYRARSKGLPAHAPSCAVEGPNDDLWTVDFKGWWYTADRRRCDPLTVRDAHSRMVLALKIVEKTRTEEVKCVFEELFEAYGLPKTIQPDNVPPFASVKSIGGLTKLSAWWVSLGIEVVRSRTASYLGKRLYVSLALPGYQVAFEQRTDVIRVWFFGQLLGGIDAALVRDGSQCFRRAARF